MPSRCTGQESPSTSQRQRGLLFTSFLCRGCEPDPRPTRQKRARIWRRPGFCFGCCQATSRTCWPSPGASYFAKAHPGNNWQNGRSARLPANFANSCQCPIRPESKLDCMPVPGECFSMVPTLESPVPAGRVGPVDTPTGAKIGKIATRTTSRWRRFAGYSDLHGKLKGWFGTIHEGIRDRTG